MIRKILIALGVAFLVALVAYLAIVMLAPGMYVEKALNILAAVFTVAGITTLVLVRRRR
jgi:hypothetical protein